MKRFEHVQVGMRRATFLLAAACIAVLAWTAPARAATFQVAAPGSGLGNDIACAPCATIMGAIAVAQTAAGHDVVQLASGTYTENFSIDLGNDVTVQGVSEKGSAATTIAPAAGAPAVRMQDGTVRKMRLVSADSVSTVEMAAGVLEYVYVAPSSVGVDMAGVDIVIGGDETPTITHSTIFIMAAGDGISTSGIRIRHPGVAVNLDNDTVVAQFALYHEQAGAISATRMHLTGTRRVLYDAVGGATSIDNSIARTSGTEGAFLLYISSGGVEGTLDLRHCTVLSISLEPNTSWVVRQIADGADNVATVNIANSAFVGYAHSIDIAAVNGGTATATVSHSMLDEAETYVSGSPGQTWTGNIVPVDPAFRDLAGGDYRLRKTSPLVDAGTPGPLGESESSVDLRGLDRIRDGNADGTEQRDIGAMEYQPAPAYITRPSVVGTMTVGRRVGCAVGTWALPPAVTTSYAWLNSGRVIAGATGVRYRIRSSDRHDRIACRVVRDSGDAATSVRSASRRVS